MNNKRNLFSTDWGIPFGLGKDTTIYHKGFINSQNILSKDYEIEFLWDNIFYTNVEAAYQSSKLSNVLERQQFSSLNAEQAKAKGSAITPYNGWEIKSKEILEDIINHKIFQNDKVRDELIATPDEVLYKIDNIGEILINLKEAYSFKLELDNDEMTEDIRDRICGIKSLNNF